MNTTNTDYINQLIQSNELIYIDTCSLLDYERLLNFLNNAKQIFIDNNKNIIVHYSVMEELLKFKFSNNEQKSFSATKAIEIIESNNDLFLVEWSNDEKHNDYDCFADPKLLSTIFERRRQYKQLLISNDHSLTSDAFNFNSFESVKGNRVSVCYLTNYGNMNMCDCVKKESKQIRTVYVKQEPKEIIKKVVVKKTSPVTLVITSTLSLVSGVTIGAFAPQLIKCIKKMNRGCLTCLH